ncbi:MAG: hypothetical protein ABIN97_07225, partial [Ginsengibacter sp.]
MFRSGFSFILIILLVYPWCTNVKAQYFYKDIWNTRQSGKGMAFLKAGNIKSISIKSFESDGEPSQGFFCEKQIDKS